jgi:hypothetical protein
MMSLCYSDVIDLTVEWVASSHVQEVPFVS